MVSNLLWAALRNKLCAGILFSVLFFNAYAQTGVVISTTTGTPDPSAMLDVRANNRGALIPRMTATERDNNITTPAVGLMIYNTTTNCFNTWQGSYWKQWCSECDFAAATVSNNGPICEGATLNLTATGAPSGATFAWTGPNGFTSTTQNPSISNASSAASGIYMLKVTKNGCTNSAVSTIATVKAAPQTPTIIPSESPICVGGTLTLNATTITGATYTWSGPSFTSSLQNPTVSNVTSANGGTYSVFATVNGCNSATQTKAITVSIRAAGGTVTHVGGYTIHTFTSSGTFIPLCTGNVEVLVVAGGGAGGGANPGGGGGAGGVIYNSSFAVTPSIYTVTIGAGGIGAAGSGTGTNGGNSNFITLTATGGGPGGSLPSDGFNGGSGGGGAMYALNGTSSRVGGSASPSGQGFAGGSAVPVSTGGVYQYATGGGGGAGGVGQNGTNDSQSNGGIGLQYSISGTPTYYGGGGGGGRYPNSPAGNGGLGGGGNGGAAGPGTNGTANTGGGGGGGTSPGGNGGSGIVIIRYAE